MREVKFRYTPVALLILLWGSLVALVILTAGAIRHAVFPWVEGMHINPYGSPGVLLICLVSLGLMAVTMIIPFVVALRLSDLHGIAKLGSESIAIQFASKMVEVAYADIKSIRCSPVPGRRAIITAPVFRLQIKTKNKTVAFASSQKEAWERRKSKKPPQMMALYKALLPYVTLSE